MTLSSILIRTSAALLVTFVIVFVTGIVAALFGAPQPLIDIIAVGVGGGVLFSIINRGHAP